MHVLAPRAAVAVLATAALAATYAVSAPAQAAPSASGCANRSLTTTQQLLECVGADTANQHLQALQAIADANGGTRSSGTPGYDESVDYVVDQLEGAGYDVTTETFDFPYFEDQSTLRQLTPTAATYDTGSYTGAGGGTVTGPVTPIDLALAPPQASTSGCQAADFAGVDLSGPNDIALIQRGACTFALKAQNAEAAGAEAVIIFNQGNDPGRVGLIVGTLGGSSGVTIPVVGASFDQGVALAEAGSTAEIVANVISELRPTENIIAELPGRNRDNVVMAGAHLDSVTDGPGIQDNGTGSAGILDVALALGNNKKFVPQNTLRFAWWGAEEFGLLGSEDYVAGLSPAELDRIAAYLNFDMIGSPNYIFGVYDADESTFAAPVVVPEGSEALEDLLEAHFTAQGVPYEDSQFSGRSDYQAFIEAGIPASGLFTGAEVAKTELQQSIWGGIAGESFDQCYHQACDTFANVNTYAFDTNIGAIADAVFRLAHSTESVNGVKGVKVKGPKQTAIAGPEGTYAEGGGGLEGDHDHHDHDHRDAS